MVDEEERSSLTFHFLFYFSVGCILYKIPSNRNAFWRIR